MHKRKHTKRVVIGVAALTMLFAGTAFTASNTVPTSNAGSGSAEVSGYTATSIDYVLNATDPNTIDSVDFVIDGEITAGSDAEVQLQDAGTWYSCVLGTYNETDTEHPLTCDTSGGSEAVADANNLSLVIAD